MRSKPKANAERSTKKMRADVPLRFCDAAGREVIIAAMNSAGAELEIVADELLCFELPEPGLVVRRPRGEVLTLRFADGPTVRIRSLGPTAARLRVAAPADVEIVREEIPEAARRPA